MHWIPTLVLQCLIGLVCISLTFYPHIKLFGSGYPGPNCFRTIQISYNGKTATATIQDEVGFVCLLTTPVPYHTPSTVPGMSFRWSRYDYGALRLLCRSECWCHLCHLVLCRRQQWQQRWQQLACQHSRYRYIVKQHTPGYPHLRTAFTYPNPNTNPYPRLHPHNYLHATTSDHDHDQLSAAAADHQLDPNHHHQSHYITSPTFLHA